MNKDLYVYNSLTRQKEKFEALSPPFVGLYVCGPTVYSDVHLGNVRTFTSFDMIYRYLVFLGYKVRYVRNITDAGHLTNDQGEGVNRMEAQAKLEMLEPMEIVQKYTVGFHTVCKLFNMMPPTIEPTATGHILEQIEMAQDLINKGYAYEVNGSVYFDVKVYNAKYNYGKLSGRNIDELIAGYRDLDAQDEKRNSIDFALWKKAGENHIMRWKSPWGEGFPGWHLECSVMSMKYLGEVFDIHGGGMDLKFPHHECEIAQNVGASGHDSVKYWLHTNMLNVNGQKMSKSLGNSILPMELLTGDHPLLDKGYSPMVVRTLFLMSHYSSELDISIKALQDAEKVYKRMMEGYRLLENIIAQHSGTNGKIGAQDKEVKDLMDQLIDSMNDDFNTAKAISKLGELNSYVFKIVNKQLEEGAISHGVLEDLQQLLKAIIFDVFGLLDDQDSGTDGKVLDRLMELIIDIRQEARTNKDWGTSDKIRDALQEIDIQIKDSKEGTSWVKG